MFLFASRLGFVLVLAMLCLGGRAARAQAAPVTYFIPFWPIGFGGDPNAGQSANTYGNFPSFDGNDARGSGLSYARYNFPNGWFVGGAGGGLASSMNGFNQYGAFGNSLSYEGVQFGYKFQNDVTIHAGFDTLKYNPSIGAPFGAFDTTSAYGAHAGVEFQAAPNVSLSLGFGYMQQQSGRIDSDINSSALPGATPSAFSSGRR
jgi:opacity protein-like surface antigen